MEPSSETGYCMPIEDYRIDSMTWNQDSLQFLANELLLPRPRSLAWSMLLEILPPLELPYENFQSKLKYHRDVYDDIRKRLTTDPRYVMDDDPLSQSDGSVWKQHFYDNELKALILQDVVRTFPDEAYFRNTDVQDLMVRVLFFWARCHQDIGYRQGMHEILAILLYELHLDRKYAPSTLFDLLQLYLAENFLEHDSYMLFSAVMYGVKRFYSTGNIVPTPAGRMPASSSVHSPNEVVKYLERVRENYLVAIDPELDKHLMECNVKLEFFGIRWLRLLFGREFARNEIALLWGYLFAEGATLPNLHYVVVAMLIARRKTLLSLNGCAVLSAAMRENMSRATHVVRLARHLASPTTVLAPPDEKEEELTQENNESSSSTVSWAASSDNGLSQAQAFPGDDADIARALGTLAVVRARLPPAAAALAALWPRPGAAPPALHDILQLSRLLECRNHEWVSVETALEAAEGQQTLALGKKELLPVARGPRVRGERNGVKVKRVKEVPLRLFYQVECAPRGDLPSQDPLRLRTE